MQKEAMDLKENDEFISDLGVDKHAKTVLATCGDGTLTVVNLRRKKLELQSELFDSEFLSLAIVKVRLPYLIVYLQPCNLQVSKEVVHELKFGDKLSCKYKQFAVE